MRRGGSLSAPGNRREKCTAIKVTSIEEGCVESAYRKERSVPPLVAIINCCRKRRPEGRSLRFRGDFSGNHNGKAPPRAISWTEQGSRRSSARLTRKKSSSTQLILLDLHNDLHREPSGRKLLLIYLRCSVYGTVLCMRYLLALATDPVPTSSESLCLPRGAFLTERGNRKHPWTLATYPEALLKI